MKRFQFSTAIRNQMASGSSSSEEGAETPRMALPARPVSWKRRLFGLVRTPLALARRYLVGGLDAKLDVTLKKLDHVTTRLDTLHPKVDNMLDRADTTVRLLSGMHQAFEVQSARADELERAISAIRHSIDTRLHQIDIKIRGPLEYDGTTWAVRTVDGYLLVPKEARELYILLADAPAEGLEPGTHSCLKALVDPGMTVVDVGANVGMLSLALARSVGSNGKVYSFEADPDFQNLLDKSFALNGVSWVELRRQAVGRASGEAVFHVSPIAGHSSLYDLPEGEARSARQITVEVVTLDEALADVEHVDLVKIDVEGAELDVLAGMESLINRNANLSIVAEFGPSHLTRVGLTPSDWFKAFSRYGYQAYAVDEAGGSCRAVEAGDVTDVTSVNIVFARPGSPAAKRLERLGMQN